MKDNCGENYQWCANWIDKISKNRKKFYNLISVANRIGVQGIVDLGVTKVASWIKYASTDDIDRVLDPAITDGEILPMRDFSIPEVDFDEEIIS
eukprot:CAMPEP_0197517108 /NCGR_PEP_ID=MMETSP1318-20131121/2077_1 /TAXON_ID=552666 /ORGANISM="Partenskyella glossopodia, Strain RCC365" /LENGTH=93 /DNA_ID=CAMNT_0043066401 /DNA_START=540 /DNA_END=819 /DNA_ORIENTATION=+